MRTNLSSTPNCCNRFVRRNIVRKKKKRKNKVCKVKNENKVKTSLSIEFFKSLLKGRPVFVINDCAKQTTITSFSHANPINIFHRFLPSKRLLT